MLRVNWSGLPRATGFTVTAFRDPDPGVEADRVLIRDAALLAKAGFDAVRRRIAAGLELARFFAVCK